MITIQTQISAPIETVWACWTQPEHITQWNFASDDWHCPSASNDLQPGGTFSWRMEAKDGSMGFDFIGTYDHIETHAAIDYHLEDERKVEIRFTVDGDTVILKESFETEGTHTDELQRQGWQAILNNFKTYAESLWVSRKLQVSSS